MNFLNYDIDIDKLFPAMELLAFLKENGESDRALARVRERYFEDFNNELIWTYPISDGKHMGVFIVCVREGFISIPYDIVVEEDYEILELQNAVMFDADSMQIFIDDWISYSEDLVGAMKEMYRIMSEQDE